MARKVKTSWNPLAIGAAILGLLGLGALGLNLLGAKADEEAKDAGENAGEGFVAGLWKGLTEAVTPGEDGKGLGANLKAWWASAFKKED